MIKKMNYRKFISAVAAVLCLCSSAWAAGELGISYATEQTIKALVWGPDRGTRWDGSDMVAPSTISDAAWATGMVSMTELQNSNSTRTGQYQGDLPATGVVGVHQIDYLIGASPTAGQRRFGFQAVGTVDVGKISGDATAAANLKLQYDTTGLTGATFPASQAQVGSAVVEFPDAGRVIAGASESNTYAKLAASDDDYWSCTDPDTSNPLEMAVYVNAADNTFPDAVVIEARYNAQNNRRVHVFAANVDNVAAASGTTATATNASPSVLTQAGVFADLTLAGFDIYITSGTNATAGFYTIASHTDDAITLDRNCATAGGGVSVIDFIVMVWDQISNDANAILHKNGADAEYEYPLGVSYMTTDTNEVFLRFSDEGQGTFKTSYDLRLDHVGIITKSLSGGSVSVETIAAAVHTELDDHFIHIPAFAGEVFYVSPTGSDANNGHDPASPLLTIGAAITKAIAGDFIKIKSGTYTEAGLDLSKRGLELHGEIGAILTGGGGVPLTISTDYCRTDEITLTPAAGQIGLVVTSDFNKIRDIKVIGGLTAVQDTGTGNEISHVSAEEYTATGFDLQGDEAHVLGCQAVSSQANTRGYYLSNATADRTIVEHSISVNNDTAGFEVVSGVTNAVFSNCVESPTCGTRVDAGTSTAWRNHARTDHQTDISAILVDTGTTLPATLADKTGYTLLGTSLGLGPTAMITNTDGIYRTPKDSTLALYKRVRIWDGTDAQQADITSITYSIYVLDPDDEDSWTVVTGHGDVVVSVAATIYDTLQTDTAATNYNFKYIPVISVNAAFDDVGTVYLVEFTITPAVGQVFIERFRVTAM